MQSILTPQTVQFIRSTPTHPDLPGMIRRDLDIPVPDFAVGDTRKLADWIVKAVGVERTRTEALLAAEEQVKKAPDTSECDCDADNRVTLDAKFRFTISEKIYGTRNRFCTGELPVRLPTGLCLHMDSGRRELLRAIKNEFNNLDDPQEDAVVEEYDSDLDYSPDETDYIDFRLPLSTENEWMKFVECYNELCGQISAAPNADLFYFRPIAPPGNDDLFGEGSSLPYQPKPNEA